MEPKALCQEIVLGLEAAERGEVAPLDIETTIAEGKRLLVQRKLDTLLQKGLGSGPATPMTAPDWQEVHKKALQNSRPN